MSIAARKGGNGGYWQRKAVTCNCPNPPKQGTPNKTHAVAIKPKGHKVKKR